MNPEARSYSTQGARAGARRSPPARFTSPLTPPMIREFHLLKKVRKLSRQWKVPQGLAYGKQIGIVNFAEVAN